MLSSHFTSFVHCANACAIGRQYTCHVWLVCVSTLWRACLQRAFFFSGFGLCVQIKSVRYLRALKETKSNSVVRQMLNDAFMSFLPFSLTCLKLGLPCSGCFWKVWGIFLSFYSFSVEVCEIYLNAFFFLPSPRKFLVWVNQNVVYSRWFQLTCTYPNLLFHWSL